MSKRRYNSKRIARSPALKRKIAELLAEYDQNQKKVTLTHVLAYGHRGYISYNEDDLCKLFDKLMTEQLAVAAEKKKSIAEQKINTRRTWEVERQEKDLAAVEAGLVKFREIADELFEAKFLL